LLILSFFLLKSQTKEPAMAVCIDDATIFGHFNRIGQNMHQINLQHTTMNHPDIPQVTNEIKQYRNQEAVSRIVYTVSGFPKALRGYLFPPAEIQKGHLFICLTLKESKIDAIARTIRIAIPFIYNNDVPDAEAASLQNLKN
ncbi:hypothetical protein T08_2012, partial [Trichinella sp. T8]